MNLEDVKNLTAIVVNVALLAFVAFMIWFVLTRDRREKRLNDKIEDEIDRRGREDGEGDEWKQKE